jgi:RNA polymerase sigma-70 factor, ECF subfamily
MSQADESRAAPGEEASDRSLLWRCRQGSQDAALQIYLRYARRLYNLARAECSPALAARVDAEDIVQSVFGSFFRGAGAGYYDVPDGEELWKLFLVIALNKIRAKARYHRADKRDARRTVGGDHLDALDAPAGADASCPLLRLVIDDTLARLPPEPRRVVALRVEGYEVAEIAERTGHSRRTVERLLQKCRHRLTELYREDD